MLRSKDFCYLHDLHSAALLEYSAVSSLKPSSAVLVAITSDSDVVEGKKQTPPSGGKTEGRKIHHAAAIYLTKLLFHIQIQMFSVKP